MWKQNQVECFSGGLIQLILYLIDKITNPRFDVTNISAKTKIIDTATASALAHEARATTIEQVLRSGFKSRFVGQVTRKIIHFHYLKKLFWVRVPKKCFI